MELKVSPNKELIIVLSIFVLILFIIGYNTQQKQEEAKAQKILEEQLLQAKKDSIELVRLEKRAKKEAELKAKKEKLEKIGSWEKFSSKKKSK